jgi:hypothetical protein
MLNPRVDRDLEAICLKCLQKEPSRRFGSARELAEDLDRYLHGEPITARRPGLMGRLGRWARHSPALAATCAALLVFYANHLVVRVGLPECRDPSVPMKPEESTMP